MHVRSRSPKLGRTSEDEERAADDAYHGLGGSNALGTFSSKKISPVGGVPRSAEDQEAPYRIALPGETSDERERRRTRQLMIEQGRESSGKGAGSVGGVSSTAADASGSSQTGQTVAERMTGPQISDRGIHNTSAVARAPAAHSGNERGGSAAIAELPGSKAEGYESEEEIQMSATAFPGQWQDPIYFDGGRWDD